MAKKGKWQSRKPSTGKKKHHRDVEKRSRTRDEFRPAFIPIHVRKDSVREHPFIVAFDTGDRFGAGTRLPESALEDLLNDYNTVIVHWHDGTHPSQKQHYLLYGDVKHLDLGDDRVESVQNRHRSREVIGEFHWFSCGKHRVKGTALGLHCLSKTVFDQLP